MGAAAVCLGGLLAGAVAFASPPHFDEPFVQSLKFFDEGSSLSLEARVRNLDPKRNARVFLFAHAELDVVCINPGGKEVDDKKPKDIEVELTGFERYRAKDIENNGRLDIEIETDEVGSKIPGAPDCPNDKWTERIKRVRFLDAELSIRQGGGSRVTVLCTFDPPTKDGRVRDKDVDCFTL